MDERGVCDLVITSHQRSSFSKQFVVSTKTFVLFHGMLVGENECTDSFTGEQEWGWPKQRPEKRRSRPASFDKSGRYDLSTRPATTLAVDQCSTLNDLSLKMSALLSICSRRHSHQNVYRIACRG